MLSVVIGYFISILIATLLFILFKYTFLNNININKWLLLLITVIILIVPIISKIPLLHTIWQYLHATLFLFFAIWFMYESGFNFNYFSKKDKYLMIIKNENKDKKK